MMKIINGIRNFLLSQFLIIFGILIVWALVIFLPRSTLFILVGILVAFTPLLQRNAEINMLRIKTRNSILYFVSIELIKSLLYFYQFFLLTRVFEYKIIVLLAVLLIIGNLVHILLGSITGFALKDKDQKIEVLTTVYGIQLGIGSKYSSSIDILYIVGVLTNLGICIYLYSPNTLISAQNTFWIGVLIFIVQELLQVFFKLYFRFTLIISEYIDDDFRNFYLSLSLSHLFYLCLLFITPFLAYSQFPHKLTFIDSVPIWAFIAMPVAVFIFLQVLPFLIGATRYSNQREAYQMTRISIIQDLLIALNMPEKVIRDQKVNEIRTYLMQNVDSLAKHNWILDLFQQIETSQLKWNVYQSLKHLDTLIKKGQGSYEDFIEDYAGEKQPEFDQNKVYYLQKYKSDLIKFDIRINEISYYTDLIKYLNIDIVTLKEYLKELGEKAKFHTEWKIHVN